MNVDLAKNVKVDPSTLQLSEKNAAQVKVANSGPQKLTYKLKTTRPMSVKPSKAFGIVTSNGNDKFKVYFKPSTDEKPFADTDRLTLLVSVMPESFQKPEDYWKSNPADVYRVVIKLAKDEKAKVSTTDEEVESEESEAETESEEESEA